MTGAIIMNGVNLQPSYYNSGNVTFGWELMHQYGEIKTLRIEIEPDKIMEGKKWIDEAICEGYSVIATYHKYQALGSDDPTELMSAANWWINNYDFLASDTSNNTTTTTTVTDHLFTINLMNEFGSHDMNASTFADMYTQAIAMIRTRTSYNGAIIVDLSGYGQEADVAAEASELLADDNLIFSMHVYPSGWNSVLNRPLSTADIDTLTRAGRPCMIGEFGTRTVGRGCTGRERDCDRAVVGDDADVTSIDDAPLLANVSDLVTYASALSPPWSVLGWAWNGDGGDMNMVIPTWCEDPVAASYQENQSYFTEILNLLK